MFCHEPYCTAFWDYDYTLVWKVKTCIGINAVAQDCCQHVLAALSFLIAPLCQEQAFPACLRHSIVDMKCDLCLQGLQWLQWWLHAKKDSLQKEKSAFQGSDRYKSCQEESAASYVAIRLSLLLILRTRGWAACPS